MSFFGDTWQGLSDAATAYARQQKAKVLGGKKTLDGRTVGGSVWDSLVKGDWKGVKEKGVKAFRESGTGRELEAEATRQKISEILSNPLTWIGVVAAVLLIGLVARKV